jgi:hypothetical protein
MNVEVIVVDAAIETPIVVALTVSVWEYQALCQLVDGLEPAGHEQVDVARSLSRGLRSLVTL